MRRAPWPGTSPSSRPAALACRRDCRSRLSEPAVRYRTEHRYFPRSMPGVGVRWDQKIFSSMLRSARFGLRIAGEPFLDGCAALLHSGDVAHRAVLVDVGV